MSYESKLAHSIQSDYRRDAAIEREFTPRASLKGVAIRFMATLAVLIILADLYLVAVAG